MDESTVALQWGLTHTTWSASDLRFAAVGIGGSLRQHEVDDILEGRRAATAVEHDILATALNDWFAEHRRDRPVALWGALGDA